MDKINGVIYYNKGTKCLIRMLVSIFSLRKHYQGNVAVICEGDQPDWFLRILKEMNVETVNIVYDRSVNSWAKKASLWRYSPFENTMFIDADTVILNPIDEYFEIIKKHGFITGNFANWKSSGGTIRKRINSWGEVLSSEMLEEAIGYGPAVNTGVVGWTKGHPMLEDWEKMSQLGYEHNCTRRIVDEVACQILLPKHRVHVVPTRWGESVKFGEVKPNTVIVHYHGSKHTGDRETNTYWKKLYKEFLGVYASKEPKVKEGHGDKALSAYIGVEEKPLTIVSAVNEKYYDKFVKNFVLWKKTDGISNYPYLIIAHEDCYDKADQFLKSFSNVKVVKWKHEKSANMREEMLTSFVVCPPRYVKTKYWMKLDGDTTPIADEIIIPDEAFRSHITATRWKYTKVKGDEKNTRHWLNILDDWADKTADFEGTSKLFNEEIEGRTKRHIRFCSFCEIEKTAWTKHLAYMVEQNGDRMPVPSQDTFSWYCAARLGRKIHFYNWKKFFRP